MPENAPYRPRSSDLDWGLLSLDWVPEGAERYARGVRLCHGHNQS
jgi:hypothetical protein